ncbi:hypothetical protein ZIOFF_024816 [Zingiber officinale]|uniref:Uncharacterized protein n=1 Tax=Zingiber officinale TaxID=94328 RepID=A0A8J5LGG9_ZINOF|nr:hypothetical protein ZIOFF_024816 [Zingiber officinale]
MDQATLLQWICRSHHRLPIDSLPYTSHPLVPGDEIFFLAHHSNIRICIREEARVGIRLWLGIGYSWIAAATRPFASAGSLALGSVMDFSFGST